MIDLKKIADAVRVIREAYAPLVRTNTVYDALTDIANELDPPEPKPEPPKEPEHTICKRCGGSQSVPSPEVSTTAYAVCPKCGGTGYEIDEQKQKKEPEKESPIDPIERPLRSLILRAKEEGKNIRTYYQDMVFTPCALDGLLADGKFRWWNISNWELTSREQNYYPQISYDEPNPEPAYKVGDWVEFKGKQYRISAIGGKGLFDDDNLIMFEGVIWGVSEKAELRKLDPSEVKVTLTLEGTVSRDYDEKLDSFILNHADGHTRNRIKYSTIDPATCTLVKNLLKAQEEK